MAWSHLSNVGVPSIYHFPLSQHDPTQHFSFNSTSTPAQVFKGGNAISSVWQKIVLAWKQGKAQQEMEQVTLPK